MVARPPSGVYPQECIGNDASEQGRTGFAEMKVGWSGPLALPRGRTQGRGSGSGWVRDQVGSEVRLGRTECTRGRETEWNGKDRGDRRLLSKLVRGQERDLSIFTLVAGWSLEFLRNLHDHSSANHVSWKLGPRTEQKRQKQKVQ
jgi:hypothetical protein